MRVKDITREALQEAVGLEFSFAAVARRLGFAKSCRTSRALSKLATSMGICSTHFNAKIAALVGKIKHTIIERRCPKCEGLFKTKSGGKSSKTFCSQRCANSSMPREVRERAHQKTRDTFKRKAMEAAARGEIVSPKRIAISTSTCPICESDFTHWSCMKRTYCSKKCFIADKEFKFRRKVSGGYRKNSGHSRSGYFRGRWCQSSYELAYTIFCLDHGIEFTRNEERFSYERDGVRHFYLPDFTEGDTLVEIKGYADETVPIKIAAVPEGRKFKMLTKVELAPYFAYIKEKYGKTPDRIIELYDGHKPIHTYECGFCHQQFGRDKKLRREVNFCSCSCAMKYRWTHGDLKQSL